MRYNEDMYNKYRKEEKEDRSNYIKNIIAFIVFILLIILLLSMIRVLVMDSKTQAQDNTRRNVVITVYTVGSKPVVINDRQQLDNSDLTPEQIELIDQVLNANDNIGMHDTDPKIYNVDTIDQPEVDENNYTPYDIMYGTYPSELPDEVRYMQHMMLDM